VDDKNADATKSDTLRNPTPPQLMGNEAWLHATSEKEQFVIVERDCERVSSSIAQTMDL